jgi:hypothetical protein
MAGQGAAACDSQNQAGRLPRLLYCMDEQYLSLALQTSTHQAQLDCHL